MRTSNRLHETNNRCPDTQRKRREKKRKKRKRAIDKTHVKRLKTMISCSQQEITRGEKRESKASEYTHQTK